MDIPLTQEQKKKIAQYNPASEPLTTLSVSLPSRAMLNMEKLPVLDQGHHGTCVTFANTAAIDFILGKGDYISQLCSLELNAYLAEKSIHPQSTWHGTSLSTFMLSQLYTFGIVSKEQQKLHGCGGLFEYPLNEPSEEGQPMSLDDFKMLSDQEGLNIGWQSLLTLSGRLGTNPDDPSPYQGHKLLNQIKTFLARTTARSTIEAPQGIVTFGAFLPIDYCHHGGACGSFHTQYDAWVLTAEINQLDPSDATLPGHAMIIFGYDDNAVAIDDEGHRHQGLLFLRNSWGDEVGSKGNFYMSYDFFKKFALEAQLIYSSSFPVGD